jgi:hypothetical protein
MKMGFLAADKVATRKGYIVMLISALVSNALGSIVIL